MLDAQELTEWLATKGYGELVSELVSFAKVARNLAELWKGDEAVANLAQDASECMPGLFISDAAGSPYLEYVK